MELALKVDVDTYEGMRDGVPNLLKFFASRKIKASFFIPFGPDESGKAIFRVFKKKGFLKKMFRTNALKLYGPRTVLRGTLLPAPLVGGSFPEIAKRVPDEGHELGIHGYNHVLWQDHLLEMKEQEVREEFERGVYGFKKALGVFPKAFAAPAWLCTPTSLAMVDEFDFSWASDTRGFSPFYPEMNGKTFRAPQVPSTLPTADELLGTGGLDPAGVHRRFTELLQKNSGPQVHTIHTEVEGTALFEPFSAWIDELLRLGTRFRPAGEFAQQALREKSKVRRDEVVLAELPGRAGKVACQKAL